MSADNVPDETLLVRLRHGTPEDRKRLAQMAEQSPRVAALLREWDRQDAALAALYDPVAQEPVPPRLTAALSVPPRARWNPARVAAMAGLVALGGALGLAGGMMWSAGSSPVTDLPQQALRSHAVYVVEKLHPVEVTAADLPHLTVWLSNRVGVPLNAPDLGAQGFALMGGRVVPGVEGTAALLMYQDEIGRRITLYVMRMPGVDEVETASRAVNGTEVFWWVEHGLACAVVGDVPQSTLRAISAAAYGQLLA